MGQRARERERENQEMKIEGREPKQKNVTQQKGKRLEKVSQWLVSVFFVSPDFSFHFSFLIFSFAAVDWSRACSHLAFCFCYPRRTFGESILLLFLSFAIRSSR